jgi:predicted O-methyltransferase YrrM
MVTEKGISGDSVVVDGIEFSISYVGTSTSRRFIIRKPPELIRKVRQLAPAFRSGNIVELGIADGGSTALLALAVEPSKLVSVELDAIPVQALTELISERDLGDVVRPYYGVDQADVHRLSEIIEKEFLGTPIDLVIDDASHLYEQTRASFEVLFPRVRPGGLYIIEDWAADHQWAHGIRQVLADPTSPHHEAVSNEVRHHSDGTAPSKQPLSRHVVELLLARACSGDAVAEVHIDSNWVSVVRGPARLDAGHFRLADLYVDYFDQLS